MAPAGAPVAAGLFLKPCANSYLKCCYSISLSKQPPIIAHSSQRGLFLGGTSNNRRLFTQATTVYADNTSTYKKSSLSSASKNFFSELQTV
jgi:heme oxygenase